MVNIIQFKTLHFLILFVVISFNASAQVMPFGMLHRYEANVLTYRDTQTEIVEVTSATGRIWMDRNLGASRAATSSTDAQAYGDLYQWGRLIDGHQIRTSSTTSTLSSGDVPANGLFITIYSGNIDWRSPQNPNLWQGVNGINNPCPSGYRLPTDSELDAERLRWGSNNSAGAYASPLKLTIAGNRGNGTQNFALTNAGNIGYYWSSSVSNTNSVCLRIQSNAYIAPYNRATAFSVRCIKD